MKGKKEGLQGERWASHGNLQEERRPAQGGKVHQPQKIGGGAGAGEDVVVPEKGTQ